MIALLREQIASRGWWTGKSYPSDQVFVSVLSVVTAADGHQIRQVWRDHNVRSYG